MLLDFGRVGFFPLVDEKVDIFGLFISMQCLSPRKKYVIPFISGHCNSKVVCIFSSVLAATYSCRLEI